MAWIESHQSLRHHPKSKRAAGILDIPLVQLVGHLHFLWWWALDIAPDGDLSDYEPWDIADAAQWEDDPDEFVKALVECGPGSKNGFLTPDLRINNWRDKGGKIAASRGAIAASRSDSGRYGNHQRWHVDREISDPDCEFCSSQNGDVSAGQSPSDSQNGRTDSQRGRSESQTSLEERRGEESNTPPEGDREDDQPLEERLADELRADYGVTFHGRDTLREIFRDLLREALDHFPEDRHRGVTIGLIARLVERGREMQLTPEARSHTAGLVNMHDPLAVFEAFAEALDWGAGIAPEYAADPQSLTKYVTRVLNGQDAA